ncbi:MAG: acyltransferase [Lactobacillus sp.]|jgi:peptidoglycan/LPS O-acetylase OafA/YrhL|nr:acyltransferase family protein [Lacticaseibacillus suilingensis]MCI1894743.1 acyltransferase [Lactobacillus sp.]MCI1942349.1 acyltransferase [Lactobacillus sp.]MCI1972795.1 acyltransferase [Lactobacillus sp.]MCI2016455.1 acyltransferase [Lactobacillus sp.]MCI2037405.1 acyltransferase [Lactobacillus sp.]
MASTTHKHIRIKWFSLVRVTGLVLVLTYHFFQNEYPGGFIGVDIFFTFSGFLITSLMIDEFARTHTFGLLAFYRRRFYRIVPPLVLAVLVVIPFTFLVGTDFITNIGQQIAAAVGFVTNFFEIATGGSYENNFIPHLFVHTWSLAVEMHFYLIWGVVAYLLSRVFQKRPETATARRTDFRMAMFGVSGVLAIVTYLLMVVQAQGLKDFSPVYFSSFTHSFPFFVGAMIGTLTGVAVLPNWFTQSFKRINAWVPAAVMAGAAALLIALGFGLDFDQIATYNYGLLVATLLAGVMIVAARILHEKTPTIAEPKVITFLADISYSLYLYHWPLYVIFSHRMDNTLAAGLTVLVGGAFSALSYYIIEPVIAGRQGKFLHFRLPGRYVAAPVIVAALALTVVTVQRVQAAPELSHLEQSLWIGGIQQDVAQYNTSEKIIMAAHDPKKTAQADLMAQAKKDAAAAAKAHPDSYAAVNQNSTAAKYGIPAGVTIIGDSVTLGTAHYLGPHVANSEVNAAGDRKMNEAYDLMMQMQQAGQLREFVVLSVGTNALDDYAQVLDRVIAGIKPGHKLVFMTPYNAQASPSWNSSKLAELERQLPAKYKWITIADWGKIAPQHPHVFKGTDGVHFGGHDDGDVLFAQTINNGLIEAAKKPAKK